MSVFASHQLGMLWGRTKSSQAFHGSEISATHPCRKYMSILLLYLFAFPCDLLEMFVTWDTTAIVIDFMIRG